MDEKLRPSDCDGRLSVEGASKRVDSPRGMGNEEDESPLDCRDGGALAAEGGSKREDSPCAMEELFPRDDCDGGSYFGPDGGDHLVSSERLLPADIINAGVDRGTHHQQTQGH